MEWFGVMPKATLLTSVVRTASLKLAVVPANANKAGAIVRLLTSVLLLLSPRGNPAHAAAILARMALDEATESIDAMRIWAVKNDCQCESGE